MLARARARARERERERNGSKLKDEGNWMRCITIARNDLSNAQLGHGL